MRKALNENPVVQAAFVGVLVLAVGGLLLLRMGSSSEPEAEAPASTATTPADPAAAAATPDPATADPAATPPASAPAAPTGESAAPQTGQAPGGAAPAEASPTDFTAGPGLPNSVAAAYNSGDAVVLLVVNERGIDDRRLKTMVKALEGQPGAAVFVTDVRDVADYSRITEGVDLDRTPALVIVRPESLTDGPMPTAVVSYGFRGAGSVEQALDDALYKGPQNLPYYPE